MFTSREVRAAKLKNRSVSDKRKGSDKTAVSDDRGACLDKLAEPEQQQRQQQQQKSSINDNEAGARRAEQVEEEAAARA